VTTTSTFDTVLVANRGEIAVRVIRSARAAGYRTVAVHSDADAGAPHTLAADQAVRIGPAAAAESYLSIPAIIAAARDTGAGAIHPGYGFLAENAAFARACAEAGITFVGPPPEAIELMGDKAAAKRRMAEAGVPLLEGYQGTDDRDDVLLDQARAIGVPLMVKAAAGGGGKGMRLVRDAAELPEAIAAARREATSAFGDGTLILERALLRPRHVEVQVLADAHGHTIALGERDCSVQRRHQKVVEEAPCPVLSPETRTAMQDAAVRAAADIGYVGAGTVEFLYDHDTATFAFLEMNTRLQVEHPVTEMVTGVDLVDWQLRIAQGEPLTISQDDVVLDGHAIEVRLYAEDPVRGYLPQVGTVTAWAPPTGPGVRVDAGLATGQAITPHYDPMIAKVIAQGRDRDDARRRLADALDRLVCLGVTTNRAFLAAVLREPTFAAGEATTALLEEATLDLPAPSAADLAALVGWRHLGAVHDGTHTDGTAGWTNAVWLESPVRLRVGEAVVSASVAASGDGLRVVVDGVAHEVRADPRGVQVDVRVVALDGVVEGDRLLARLPHVDLDVVDVTHLPPTADDAAGAGVLIAPMHGAVTSVPVAVGDQVGEGDVVVVMEAMKMEHVIRADVAGTVAEVVAEGTQVADRDVVARLEPAED